MNYVSGQYLCDFLSNLVTYYNNHKSNSAAAKSFNYTPTEAIKKACLTAGQLVAVRHAVWNSFMNLNITGGKTRQQYIDSSNKLAMLDGGASENMTKAQYQTFLHDTIDKITTTITTNVIGLGAINVGTQAAENSSGTRRVIKNMNYNLSPTANKGWMGKGWTDNNATGSRTEYITSPSTFTYEFTPGANHFYYSDTQNIQGGAYISGGNLQEINYGNSQWIVNNMNVSTIGTIPAGKWLTVLNSSPIYTYNSSGHIQGYQQITKAVINNQSSGVSSIPSDAFDSCSNLRTVEIGTGSSVSGQSFNLTGYSRPITSFGLGAFRNCTNLQQVTIGASCQNGNSAISWDGRIFEGCTNLQKVYINCPIPPNYSGVNNSQNSAPYWFSNYPEIIVPAASVYDYRSNTNWCTYSYSTAGSRIHGLETIKPNSTGTPKYYVVKCNHPTTIFIGPDPTNTTGSYSSSGTQTISLTAGSFQQIPQQLTNFDIIHSDYPLEYLESITRYIYPNYNSTILANWQQYLTINGISWGGTSTNKTCYNGESITVSINIPNYNTKFTYKIGNNGFVSGQSNSHTFTMSDDVYLTLSSYTRITRNISITSPNATISATQDGEVVNFTVSGNIYSASFNQGANIVLTATPNTGYSFTSWSGDSSSGSFILGDHDYNIVANCTVVAVQYSVVITNDGHGTAVITKVNGSAIAETTTTQVNAGDTITIKSKNPNSGYSFDKWDDGVYTDERTITINQNTTLKAIFDVGISPAISSFARADFLQSLAPSTKTGGFIDTNLPMTNSDVYNTYRHEFKLRFDDITNYASQGATWNSSEGVLGVVCRTADNYIALKRAPDGPNANAAMTKTITKDAKWHVYDLTSTTSINIDGATATSSSAIQLPTTSTVPEGNLILFGRVCYNWNNGDFLTKSYTDGRTGRYHTYKMSIAYYKIYNASGTLLHYFIPVKFSAQGDVYGMWDRISGNFFSVENNMTNWQLGNF